MGAIAAATPAAADAPSAAAGAATSSKASAVDGAYSGLLEALRRSPKQLPCSYLYDAAGSELYERITELEEYYPFRTEQAMLRQHAREIVSYIAPGSVVVELGCGSAQKTSILLNQLLARDGPEQVRFAGIDCSGAALDMAKAALLGSCEGLAARNITLVCKEYTQGVAECRRLFPDQQLVVLWLGSSIGNLSPAEAVQFFQDMTASAGTNIQVLLCADLWKQRDVLHAAYCDREGVTEAFIKNGLRHAFGSLSCAAAADPDNWDYEVDVNPTDKQVEMWLRAKVDIGHVSDGVSIAAGERVLVEVSRKFTPERLAGLAYKSGLYIQVAWRTDMYSMQLLVSPAEALRRCWADADAFFGRIPDWSAHPIAVRHPFCFYYGHIASFAKIKMLPDMPMTRMDEMMSRGIDPDVADPTHCHSHPDVPDKWPSRQELRAYVADTRAAILQHSGLDSCCRHEETMRKVCLALEHERMHLETLMYMAVQQVKADFLAGPERPATPRGSQSAKEAASGGKAAACNTVSVPEGTVQLGAPMDGSAGFVWDNEGPPQPPQQVAAFRAAPHPVTIGEFYNFAVTARGYECPELWSPEDHALFAGRGQVLPATWSQAYEGASVFVHWPNGSTCGWRDVADEPVLCSLAEAQAYCRFRGAGARVMSEPEYERLLLPDVQGRVEQLRFGGWEWTSTPFQPLQGFEAMPEYPEYSTDFFDGKHFVLRGASSVTDPAMRRDSFRNFYQKQYPYVFAKFRLCYDAAS